MAINNTLRHLRQECGFTQEQVAEKLNVTRQAVSSYESGRTRPDIDTLMRFAEIYGTDLEEVVYGNTRRLKALRNVKIVAYLSLILPVLLVLISSALRWSGNRFFPLVNKFEPTKQYIDQHFSFSNAADITEGLALSTAFWLLIVLAFFILIPKCKIKTKTKLLYILIFIVLLFCVSLPFGIADPLFGNINYTLTPIRISVRLIIFFIIESAVELILKKRSNPI